MEPDGGSESGGGGGASGGGSSGSTERVRYVAVARLADRLPIAAFAPGEGRGGQRALLDKKLERVLGSGRVSEHTRLTITDREVGSIHYDTDPTCLYLVVCDPDYPQRTAFKFLAETRAAFAAKFADDVPGARHSTLSRAARETLRALCDKYNSPANVDKVAAVSLQVEEVKGVMQNNIESVLRNQENIETLLDQTHAMKNEANGFNRTAGRVKDKMWWQNFKMQLVIAALVAILILIIVVPLVTRRGGGSSNNTAGSTPPSGAPPSGTPP